MILKIDFTDNFSNNKYLGKNKMYVYTIKFSVINMMEVCRYIIIVNNRDYAHYEFLLYTQK